jgi:hypothetical protein
MTLSKPSAEPANNGKADASSVSGLLVTLAAPWRQSSPNNHRFLLSAILAQTGIKFFLSRLK